MELLGDLLFKVCSRPITATQSPNLIIFMSLFIPSRLLGLLVKLYLRGEVMMKVLVLRLMDVPSLRF